MFFTRRRQKELETLIKSEQQKCVQEILLVIQSTHEDVKRVVDCFELNIKSSDDSPSKRAQEFTQRLDDYQKDMDSMAGSVVDGALPDPPRRNG